LFYTDGTTAWGKNHVIMPSQPVGGLGGDPSSTESAIIVPKPGLPNVYYIFSTPAQSNGAFQWATVDMSLNGGNGDLTSVNNILHTPTSEKVCAIGNCSGTEYWVLSHPADTDTFYAYKVTSLGISAPVKTKIGVNYATYNTIGYMKFSGNGSKVAVSHNGLSSIEIFDFDVATGVLSNLITDTMISPYGCSFSPNSSLLYFGTSTTIWQYDMSLATSAAILASRVNVGNSFYSALQNAINGKMYVADYLAADVGVINFPNVLGVGCNFVAAAQSISPKVCRIGLPAILENFLSAGGPPVKLKFYGCNGLDSVYFNTLNNVAGATYSWNFNDPNSGVNNTSTIANPFHAFSSNNIYNVQVIVSSSCGTDTVIKQIVVDSIPTIIATQNDTLYCTPGSRISIKANAFPLGGSYEWTPTTTINCTICDSVVVNPMISTNYVVKYTGMGGCIATDTVKLKIRPLPTVAMTLSPDSVCLATAIAPSLIGTTSFIKWVWNFNDGTFVNGNTTAGHTYLNSGSFNIAVYIADTLGCKDTLNKKVFIDNPNKAFFTVLDDSVCIGEPIAISDTLNATYNFTYDFKDGFIMNNIADPIHIYGSPSTYNIVQSVKNIKCPNSTFTVPINIFSYPIVDLGPDRTICPDSTVPFSLNASGGTYLWSNGATTNNILISEPGTYFVTVNNIGCKTSDTLDVKRDCYLNIPNAFTPNEDGLNDYFLPRELLSSGLTSFDMHIFNRWGENIYTTTSTTGRGWDGKYGGKPQPMGVYVYQINVLFKNGMKKSFTGNVTLLR
jgi:gliding motility-associated-like protein